MCQPGQAIGLLLLLLPLPLQAKPLLLLYAERTQGGGESQQGPSTPVLTSPLTLAPSVLSDTPAQRETPQIAYQSSQAQGKAPGAQQ